MNAGFSKSSAAGLVDRGTFRPATSPAGLARSYERTRYTGALIHLDAQTFYYGSNSPAYASIAGLSSWNSTLNQDGVNPPPRSVWTMQSIDWRAVLRPLKALGFDYIVIVIHMETGLMPWKPRFKTLYQSQTTINTRSTGFPAPYFIGEHYAVQDYTSEMNYVDKFFVACRDLGILPGVYMNELASWPDLDGYANVPAVPAALLENYIQYRCLLAQDIVLRWKPDTIWVDCAAGNDRGGVPANAMARLYNAIKSVDPTCIVVGNNLGEPGHGRDYYDAASQELNINAAAQPNYYTDPVDGVQRYLEREYVHSVWKDGRWYYLQDANGNSPNVFYDNIPEWQGHVNDARSKGFPFLAGFGLTRQGTLPPGLLNFLGQIDFSH